MLAVSVVQLFSWTQSIVRLAVISELLFANQSVFCLLLRLSTRHCPHLLLSAGVCCTALSIDITCPQGA